MAGQFTSVAGFFPAVMLVVLVCLERKCGHQDKGRGANTTRHACTIRSHGIVVSETRDLKEKVSETRWLILVC